MNYNNIFDEKIRHPLTKDNLKQMITKSSHMYKEWKRILKKYDIRLKIINDPDENVAAGTAEVKINTIEINIADMDKQHFISVILHEFAHFMNMQNEKYEPYHRITEKERWKQEERDIVIKTAFKAEKYTDRVARKIMKELYPGFRYIKGYVNEEDKKWLLDGFR